MNEALSEANLALLEEEIPVGAVIVKDEKIIGRGHNEREKKNSISSHAEIEAIENAEKALGTWTLEGATIYVTLEPCLMCSGAILQSRISRVVYGAEDPSMGAVTSHYYAFDDPTVNNRPLLTKGVLKEKCSIILKRFFEENRKDKKH